MGQQVSLRSIRASHRERTQPDQVNGDKGNHDLCNQDRHLRNHPLSNAGRVWARQNHATLSGGPLQKVPAPL